MDKLGLFLCTGCKIGESLDVDGFKGVGKEKGAQTFLSHPCLCSPEGVAEINKAVDDGTVNGVLIAACSHRVKREEFRFDPTKVVVERASLREQVVWSHEANHEDTQMLAEDLIRMGLARVAKNTLTVPIAETIESGVASHREKCQRMLHAQGRCFRRTAICVVQYHIRRPGRHPTRRQVQSPAF